MDWHVLRWWTLVLRCALGGCSDALAVLRCALGGCSDALVVLRQTRQAGRVTFLEASVENLNKSAPLLLDYIKLLPDEHLLVEQLSTSAVLPQPDPSQDPLAPYINSLQVPSPPLRALSDVGRPQCQQVVPAARC